MDAWDDSFREPTEDERTARRMAALAVRLINARHPVTTATIREEFYPSLADEAFRKAYRRDRERLASTGIVVTRADLPTGDAAWQIDEGTSFVRNSELTPEDALVLDCLLLPIAADPSFPYANDLRIALTKIDRSFVETSAPAIPPDARSRSKQLSQIEGCMVRRHAAQVTYERADGSRTTRSIIPYGLFPLRNTTYLVAARLNDEVVEEPHVYNMDRMRSVRELKRVTYPIPADFDVRDFVKLPFQLGPRLYVATFEVPPHRMADVREHVAQRGTWEGNTVSVDVANEDAAAAWALAEGIRPYSPASLVEAWKGRVTRWLANNDREEAR